MADLITELGMHPKWSLFLMLAGVIAIVTAISSLFLFVGDTGNKLSSSRSLPPPDSEEFFQIVANTTHSPEIKGGEVKILHNGDGFFPEFYKAIEGAQKTINITWYVWEEGTISKDLHKLLKDRLEAGVEVRILLDGFGGKMPEEERSDLEKSGAIIQDFREPSLGKLSRFHRRMHRRAVIIDGKVGFTGGMAVADYWLGDARNSKEWRDIMVKATGPLARSLQGAFADVWAGAHGEILAGKEHYPTQFEENNNMRAVHLVSSPFEDTQLLPSFYWLSISAAQKNLYITTPYFIPSPAIIDTLIERASKGVDVRLLLPNEHNDQKSTLHAARSHYGKLLEGGVRVYEYQPTMIHSKYILTDDTWVAIGSPNIDYHSMEFNEENIFGFQSQELAQEVRKMFNDDLSKAKEINLEEWKKRGFKEKFWEFFYTRFSKQL